MNMGPTRSNKNFLTLHSPQMATHAKCPSLAICHAHSQRDHDFDATKYSDKSPQELFSGVNILPKIKHFHTFTCPTYILGNTLQGQHYLPKWKERAQLGVYLGSSPNHSRTVHLILNPRTGHVSPQYHVKHDDFFESVTGKSSNFNSPEPTWKKLSGLMKNDHKSDSSSRGATTSLTPRNNTTRLDDLNDINLPQ